MDEKKDDAFLKALKDYIILFLKYILVLFVLTTFLVRSIRVEGNSMYPTLHDGEMGLSNIFSVKFGSVNRFDIVIVYLSDQNKYIVKRVIGLPGETVSYKDDQLYINNKKVEEPFLDTEYVHNFRENPTSSEGQESLATTGDVNFTNDFNPVVLSEDEYYLLGDNRPFSSDSRYYGTFNRSEIKSKNVFILYPFNTIRYQGGE